MVLVNKRGLVQDMMFFFIFSFMFAVFLLGMYIAWNETNTAFQDNDLLPANAKTMFQTQTTSYGEWADNTWLTVFIGIVIGILILSYFLSTHPVMFWGLWLVVMVFGAAAGYLANAWEVFSDIGELGVAKTQFPIMDYVVSHYLHFIIILGFLMVIVYFAKPSESAV